MKTFRIPQSGWIGELRSTIQIAQPGDTIIVPNGSAKTIGEHIMKELGKSGITFETRGMENLLPEIKDNDPHKFFPMENLEPKFSKIESIEKNLFKFPKLRNSDKESQ